MKKKSWIMTLLSILTLLFASLSGSAQQATTFASGLSFPAKIINAPGGNLLVAETGTTPNSGRVSIVDRNGNRRTLIDGLPSGINTATGGQDPSGPSGLALKGNTLYVCIGGGDGTLAGPVQGTEIPNPSPASPWLSSVLTLKLSTYVEESAGNFSFTPADREKFLVKPKLALSNSSGETLTLEVLANFPNYVFEPRPNFAGNVRASNPFGIVINGKTMYVTDASRNVVYTVGLKDREVSVLTHLAPKANPLPFGPPVVDAVPDSIRLLGKQLLLTYLTGFPFAPGNSEVRKVNLANNSQTTFIGGLTSAIDVLPIDREDGQRQFLVLEFSANMLQSQPGRLLLFSAPTASPIVVTGGLNSPTSLAFDEETGDIFISEIFTGRILKVTLQ